MITGVKGTGKQLEEFSKIMSKESTIKVLSKKNLVMCDVIFDLDFDDNPVFFDDYLSLSNKLIVLGAVKKSLLDVLAHTSPKLESYWVGMNTLPTFIHRSLVEFSAFNDEAATVFQNFLANNNLLGKQVADRVGMVTPRVVCMIINEAYFTVQEGTASKADIDLGMKLGTAYPLGPFEWCETIGIENVYTTLLAIYQDTLDERYKICPLLKTEFLRTKMGV